MSPSGIVRSRAILKGVAVVLALAALLVLPGCWVESINPLYEDGLFSSKDPDVVFDQRLNGSWSAVLEKSCAMVLTVSAKDDIYDLQSTQQGDACGDAGKKSHQQGRLVRLDKYYFFDVSPVSDDVCDECLGKHTIFQAKIEKDAFSLIPIDSDWLKKSIAAKTVTLATMPDDSDTLVASSKDLKNFCRKYAEDKEAFKAETDTLIFKRN